MAVFLLLLHKASKCFDELLNFPLMMKAQMNSQPTVMRSDTLAGRVFTHNLFSRGLRVSSQLAVSSTSTKALLLQPAGPSLQVCVSVLRARRHLAGLTLTEACVWTC